MAETLQLFLDRIPSPVGEFLVVTDGAGRLRATQWNDHEAQLLRQLRRHAGATVVLEPRPRRSAAATALVAYFAGEVHAIDDLPVETSGTPFQRAVWTALRSIPCAATVSYGEIARRIDRPTATRAVGMANNANPVGVVVPCHRVVGASGDLTGYGGGLERKRWLLAHETRHACDHGGAAVDVAR